jgi:hypothetical protein
MVGYSVYRDGGGGFKEKTGWISKRGGGRKEKGGPMSVIAVIDIVFRNTEAERRSRRNCCRAHAIQRGTDGERQSQPTDSAGRQDDRPFQPKRLQNTATP